MIELLKHGLCSAALVTAIAVAGCDNNDTASNTGTGGTGTGTASNDTRTAGDTMRDAGDATADAARDTGRAAGDLARDTGDAAQRGVDDAQTAAARAGASTTQPAGGLIGERVAGAAEKQFILQAAKLVTFEEKAAELAEDKAADDATKQFASGFQDQTESFGDELKRIATRMNINVPDEVSPEHQRLLDELKNAAPEQVSQKFRQVVQQVHQQTIQLYQQAQNTVQTPELKEHVNKALPILQQHLQQLQQPA